MGEEKDPVKITVRLPADLHAALAAAAREDRRSLNAEMEVLLREALERRSSERRGQG